MLKSREPKKKEEDDVRQDKGKDKKEKDPIDVKHAKARKEKNEHEERQLLIRSQANKQKFIEDPDNAHKLTEGYHNYLCLLIYENFKQLVKEVRGGQTFVDKDGIPIKRTKAKAMLRKV